MSARQGALMMEDVKDRIDGFVLAPDADFTASQLFWRIAPTVACLGGFGYCVLRSRRP